MSTTRRRAIATLRTVAALPLLALCTLTLGACQRPADAPPASAESDTALLRAIEAPQDKARAVEADLMEAKRRDDAAIEAQGG